MGATLLNIVKSNRNVKYVYRKIKSDFNALKDATHSHVLSVKSKTNHDCPYPRILNWRQFSKQVRKKHIPLLLRLNDFPNSILVAGCQRSGTTMLSRIITQSEGMVQYWKGRDDELDAALILSGVQPYHSVGRHCFQTTYLNESVEEYHDPLSGQMGHKLIWVLRHPFSVIYSMLYNWEDFALNELFQFCGVRMMNQYDKASAGRIPKLSRLEKACYSYNAKASQIITLREHVPDDRLLITDYEILVKNRHEILPQIYKFVDLSYHADYANKISDTRLERYKTFSKKELDTIRQVCVPIYEQAKSLIKISR